MINRAAFWEQVRLRRNLVFVWWVAWLPIGAIFTILFAMIFGHEPAPPVMFSLLLAYGAVWYWLHWRLRSLRCPKCHRPAIAHPFFFMNDVRCRHCGFMNEQS